MILPLAKENGLGRPTIASLADDGATFIKRHWKLILTLYLAVIIGLSILYAVILSRGMPLDLTKRAWGGFDERPTTSKCYQQERTAMLLSLILGWLGIDQFYARHWPLAVFKLLTLGGCGIWWFVDDVLWAVGGVYGTPGCPGGSKHPWEY